MQGALEPAKLILCNYSKMVGYVLGNQLRIVASRTGVQNSRRMWPRSTILTCAAQGVEKQVMQEGNGPSPKQGQKVSIVSCTPLVLPPS